MAGQSYTLQKENWVRALAGYCHYPHAKELIPPRSTSILRQRASLITFYLAIRRKFPFNIDICTCLAQDESFGAAQCKELQSLLTCIEKSKFSNLLSITYLQI
jgi:hypothetical protein